MLSGVLRLRSPRDFQTVREKGGRWRNDLLVLNVLPNDRAHNRYGFVVSKRIGNAVKRNRLKRRLRAIIRGYNNVGSGYDIVVIARVNASQASYHQLEQSLRDLLIHAKLVSA